MKGHRPYRMFFATFSIVSFFLGGGGGGKGVGIGRNKILDYMDRGRKLLLSNAVWGIHLISEKHCTCCSWFVDTWCR